MQFSSRLRSVRSFCLLALLLLGALASAQTWTPNAQERDIAARLASASGQRRAFLVLDPILSRVARERAADMARREYFSHTNPDGHEANYLVRQAGYTLPSHYPSNGNTIESIAAGQPTASVAWSDWMNSADHKRHLLGEASGFAEQTSYGIGYYEDPGAPYRYYWAVLTAPPNGSLATLTIAAPSDGAALPEGAVVVAGSTTGAPAAVSVQLLVENAGGSFGWLAASGTGSWQASLTNLAPGRNTLRVRSLAANGALLAETARAVDYVVQRPLTVNVQGQGSVGPFAGTTQRKLGRTYTLTATPAADWLFAGWSGSWGGSSPSATITMREGLVATATFVPNPFLALRGGYSGLVGESGAAHDSSGLLRLALDGLGSFSGRLFFAGKDYALLGQFGADREAIVKVSAGGPTPLKLNLTLETNGQITGTLKNGTVFLNLAASPVLQTGSALAALAGDYPLTVSGSGTNAVLVGKVDTAGRVKITGTLADSTALLSKSWLAADGRLPFYAPLYGSAGSLTGVLTFRKSPQPVVSGSLRWSRPGVSAIVLGVR